jgi:hypothetical protein
LSFFGGKKNGNEIQILALDIQQKRDNHLESRLTLQLEISEKTNCGVHNEGFA